MKPTELTLCDKHKIEMTSIECFVCEDAYLEEEDELTGHLFSVNCYSCGGSGMAKFKVCSFCEEEALEREQEYLEEYDESS